MKTFELFFTEQQSSMDQLAISKGYTPGLYSGSLQFRGYIYRRAETNGVWASDDIGIAKDYAVRSNNGGPTLKIALRLQNPLDLRPLGLQATTEDARKFLTNRGVNLSDKFYEAFQSNMDYEEQDTWFTYSIIDGDDWKNDRRKAIQAILDAGYNSLLLKDSSPTGKVGTSYVVFKSGDAKLMQHSLIDGEYIPSSLRFDPSNPDIRF